MANGDRANTPGLFFTYRKSTSQELEQGDLLAKTQEIQEILGKIHPYYLRDEYTHLSVLTQSCDLVRRKGKSPKSRYLTLAAVRPLHLLVKREVEKCQKDEFEIAGKVCSNEFRLKLKQFLERLFNYNEPEYFYLHSEANLDFPDPHCAFLSVPIKASLHYDACLRARMLSLDPLYQAKLGWMVGNMYSRIGTEDWVPTVETKDEFEGRIRTLLDKSYKWEDQKKLQKAKDAAPDELLHAGHEAIQKHISAITVSDPAEEFIETVLGQLRQVITTVSDEDSKKIGNRLRLLEKWWAVQGEPVDR